MHQVLVGDLSCYAQAIDQSLLLLDLSLLNGEFILHLLEILCQELVLLAIFLSGHGELLVLLLGIHKIKSDSTELLFSLVDFIHVRTGFESRFFNQLRLVV